MNQRNRFNPLKPFYIYEMKNTNNFSAYSYQPSAISNDQKLLYQAGLTTGCHTGERDEVREARRERKGKAWMRA